MELNEIKFGAFALLSIVMTSCALDEDFRNLETSTASDGKNSKEIGFNVHSGQLTRTSGSYSNAFCPTQFEITAFDGDDNYYNGGTDLVSSSDKGKTWTSDHRRYWPTDRNDSWDGLTFFAYIDGNESSLTRGTRSRSGKFDISGAVPAIRNFEVDSDIHAQRDLMYAVAKDVKRNASGKVNLSFRHALSQVSFTAQNCNPNLDDIEILSIELGGVKGAGTYYYPENTTEGGYSVELRSGNTGRWILDRQAADECYILSDINMNLGATINNGKGDLKSISVHDVSGSSSAMFLIPQTVESRFDRNVESGAYIKVMVKKTLKGASGPSSPEEVFIPVSVEWEEGRSYVYNISWHTSVINFSVTVSDYSDSAR